jgi:hypothetical protein
MHAGWSLSFSFPLKRSRFGSSVIGLILGEKKKVRICILHRSPIPCAVGRNESMELEKTLGIGFSQPEALCREAAKEVSF